MTEQEHLTILAPRTRLLCGVPGCKRVAKATGTGVATFCTRHQLFCLNCWRHRFWWRAVSFGGTGRWVCGHCDPPPHPERILWTGATIEADTMRGEDNKLLEISGHADQHRDWDCIKED